MGKAWIILLETFLSNHWIFWTRQGKDNVNLINQQHFPSLIAETADIIVLCFSGKLCTYSADIFIFACLEVENCTKIHYKVLLCSLIGIIHAWKVGAAANW